RPVKLPASTDEDITLASGTAPVGPIQGDGALLFTLDPSRYSSGSYDLILTATDSATTPHTTTITQRVTLSSQVQLGNLTLPVTDLTVDVPGGQPIVISRVYDSQ